MKEYKGARQSKRMVTVPNALAILQELKVVHH